MPRLSIAGLMLPKRTTTAASVTADAADFALLCDATGGAVTVDLPPAADVSDDDAGGLLYISKSDASGNTVTIDASGAEEIDGSTTVVLSTQFDSRLLMADGSGWVILSS